MDISKFYEVRSVINPSPIPVGMAIQIGTPPVQSGRILVGDVSPDFSIRILGVSLLAAITKVLATIYSSAGALILQTGIAVDPNTRNVFILDINNNCVHKFSSNFVFIKSWGSEGSNNSQFLHPTGIAVDSNGDIYVADTQNHRIQKFDNNGVFIKMWGKEGTVDGEFSFPWKIAVESDDDILITDTGHNRVQKFKSDGEFIRKWGSSGNGNGEFGNPTGIAVDSNDNNYVIDNFNRRIEKFDRNGIFIKAWGSQGTGDGQFMRAWDITYNGLNGNLLVSDIKNKNIQIFTTNGVFSGKVNFGAILQQ